MAVLLAEADTYFQTQVLYNDVWVNADTDTKTRALNNAESVLYRQYKRYNSADNPLPNEAIYEQALWLLRLDDSLRKGEQGVSSIMVDGIQIALSKVNRSIAPQVYAILGRKIGSTTISRRGRIV